jgi:hypothetical protein
MLSPSSQQLNFTFTADELPNLAAGVKYKCKLAAVNLLGEGVFS